MARARRPVSASASRSSPATVEPHQSYSRQPTGLSIRRRRWVVTGSAPLPPPILRVCARSGFRRPTGGKPTWFGRLLWPPAPPAAPLRAHGGVGPPAPDNPFPPHLDAGARTLLFPVAGLQ